MSERAVVAPNLSGSISSAGKLVDELAAALRSAGISDHRREASDIIAAILDVPRFWPATHCDELLDQRVLTRARDAADRRVQGAPFAYAVGQAAFRHLTLNVDERVLIPRAETELLVEEVLARRAGGIVVDVGTGSGAIALALASEGEFDQVIATDVSTGALAVARSNLERLAPRLRSPVELRAGSGLAPVRGLTAAAIVSNPPYIAHAEASELPTSVRDWEPAVALFSGDDGMRDTARLIEDAAGVLEPGGLLALEVDSRRASRAAKLASNSGFYSDVIVRPDLTGRDRILLATRAAE
jgi:release factor glutamine methyltransferase